MRDPFQIAFPMSVGPDGRLATADNAAHIRSMIEQLLFTNPGERVNRPDFGGGLNQLLFAPNSMELRATVQFTLMASLQHELGDLIDVTSLAVDVDAETLTIHLDYRILRSGEQVATRIRASIP